LLFSQIQRRPASPFFASSGAAVAALADLRLSFPRLVDPPTFVPRTRPLGVGPAWLAWLQERLGGRLAVAALAAVTLTVATALPAWAALQPSAPAASVAELRSSPGVTGTGTSRLEDLSVGTFLRELPLVQHFRFSQLATRRPQDGFAFVLGAREASIARYGESLSARVVLPQLDGAIRTKQAASTWMVAGAEADLAAQERAAAEAAAQAERETAERPHRSVPGGIVAGSLSGYVTYYDCVPDGFCGTMSSGELAFEGAAACSYDLPLGTRFTIAGDPTGRVYVCLDRGAVAATWVDIWFYDSSDGAAWQASVGSYGEINVIE